MLKRKALFKTKYWQKKFQKDIEKNLCEAQNINLLNLSIDKLDVTSENIKKLKVQKSALENQEFYFLNIKINFETQLGWNDPEISQLWRYNLHYFNYFRTLIEIEKINPNYENYLLMKRYVNSWIENNNKVGQGDGWHPYTISLRLVNWILAYSAFSSYLDEDKEFKDNYLKSIITQNQFLLDNLEYDVVGNHLFENLKTLIICGMFYSSTSLGKASKLIGEKELIKQLDEQFHSDGGHFELSAMYHSILLKGLTELTFLYRNFRISIPEEILDVQNQAYKYLANIVHPDGEIPLFNDAAFGIADSPNYLFNYAFEGDSMSLNVLDFIVKMNGQGESEDFPPSTRKVFFAKDSGYLKTEDQFMYSILDIGKPCPDYLPAHAHADIFTYELSINGRRVVVDTGTYEYSGSRRDYDRSTIAHNTLTVNEENQSQVWGSFRVADRGFPTIKSYSETESSVEIVAFHDGYKKKYKALHTRRFKHVFNQAILILDDVNANEKVQSYIHLHPDTTITLNKNIININGNEIILKPINAKFLIEVSVYHPRFGEEISIKKIIVSPLENKAFGYYYCFGKDKLTLDAEKIVND